jgi:hypothetical protein
MVPREPSVATLQAMRKALAETPGDQKMEAVYATAFSASPMAGVTEAITEVIAAARDMPRATLTAGDTETINHYPLPAHAVWRLDRALTALDRLIPHTERG